MNNVKHYTNGILDIGSCDCHCHNDHEGLGHNNIRNGDKMNNYIAESLRGWEERAVGKNVHSVYVHCYECRTDGVNFPLERKCGNCGSMDTSTYYDKETISIILIQELQAIAEKTREETVRRLTLERLEKQQPTISPHPMLPVHFTSWDFVDGYNQAVDDLEQLKKKLSDKESK